MKKSRGMIGEMRVHLLRADSAIELPIQNQVLLILNRKQRILPIYQHLWMKIPMSGRLIMARMIGTNAF